MKRLLLLATLAVLAAPALALPYIPPEIPPIVGYIGPVTPFCLVGGVYRANAAQPDVSIDGHSLYGLEFVNETLPSGLISWRTTIPQSFCDGQIHRIGVTVWIGGDTGSRMQMDNDNQFFRQPFVTPLEVGAGASLP